MGKIIYRKYQLGDEIKHIELMWNSSPHVRNRGYWGWLNGCNWGGEAIIYYAFDNNQLIGSYVVHPVSILIKGKLYKAGFATQLLVHSNYRGLTVFKKLSENIYESCLSSDIDFVFGFPNELSWNLHLRLFNWENVGRINHLECRLDSVLLPSKKYKVTNFIRSDVDLLKKLITNLNVNKELSNCISFKKDIDWFIWRYISNPLQHYNFLCIKLEDEIKGVIIIKYFNIKGILIGNIVDMIVADNDVDVLNSLLAEAFYCFKFVGVNEVSLWKPFNDWIKKHLIGIGFDVGSSYSNFGLKKISKVTPALIYDVNNWDVVMGNSDAF